MLASNEARTRRKLLILCQKQFGYHIDTYYYCKYLKDAFDITYICWDYSLTKIFLDDINVLYVSRTGNKAIRVFRYLITAISLIRKKEYHIHFIKYFFGCSFLKICFPLKKFVFDIRTGSVDEKFLLRYVSDLILRFESLFFRNITVISQSLAKKIKLQKKSTILPLGADVISSKEKNFDEINLLYVGTLHHRSIDKTVHAFARFYDEYKNVLPISYTIIGSGYHEEEDSLRKHVQNLALQNVVHVMGRVLHNQLDSFFDSHNVGVSFVPMTDFFDVQPVTKTFEHLVSGMPVIATATSENRLVVNEDNGVLITDTPDGFYDGLKQLVEKKDRFNSGKIMRNSEKYQWGSIVGCLQKYLLAICQ